MLSGVERSICGRACVRPQAFTLVEVAIALAVVSFALIALIGLISVSLQSSKSANHDTEIALASQYALSTLCTNSFANLVNLQPVTNYFDYQGSPTSSSSTSDPAVFSCITQTSTNLAPFSWANQNTNFVAVELTFTWPGQTNIIGNNAKVIWTSISAY